MLDSDGTTSAVRSNRRRDGDRVTVVESKPKYSRERNVSNDLDSLLGLTDDLTDERERAGCGRKKREVKTWSSEGVARRVGDRKSDAWICLDCDFDVLRFKQYVRAFVYVYHPFASLTSSTSLRRRA